MATADAGTRPPLTVVQPLRIKTVRSKLTACETDVPSRWQVLKVGTSSLVRPEHGTVNLSSLSKICEAARDLLAAGDLGIS